MQKCSFPDCNKELEFLPFTCKFCGQDYCAKHRLPESHRCYGLEKYKEMIRKENKPLFGDTSSSSWKIQKNKKLHKKISNRITNRKIGIIDNILKWLGEREYHRYDIVSRLNYVLSITLGFIISIIGYIIFYSNATKLNSINFWVFNIGGVLILVSLFFTVKFGWKIIEEFVNIIKRQINGIRFLIIILCIFLLWRIYVNKNTILNPVFEFYNRTNFSLFIPIKLNTFEPESYNQSLKNLEDNLKGFVDPKSQINVYELEKEVYRLVNLERTKNGLNSLIWDDKIAIIAREHSQDMAENKFFSHYNLRGEGPTERGERHGYLCRKDYGSYYTYGLAENIAQTPIYSNVVGCGSTKNLQSLAECIVAGWMSSPSHHENILTNTYTKTGVGIAYSEDDKAYSTQIFC
ncbi:MAG: CAP domain-containing protein [Candidatus Aenigmatarchaeota archaeon]